VPVHHLGSCFLQVLNIIMGKKRKKEVCIEEEGKKEHRTVVMSLIVSRERGRKRRGGRGEKISRKEGEEKGRGEESARVVDTVSYSNFLFWKIF